MRAEGDAPKACPNTPNEPDSRDERSLYGGTSQRDYEVGFVVWEGLYPTSHKQASRIFDALYRRYIYPGPRRPPSKRIREYVATLLAQWPDLSELPDECDDLSPWPRSPLIHDASGPFFYFGIMMRPTSGWDAWKYAVATARKQGLVAFDPDSNRILAGR